MNFPDNIVKCHDNFDANVNWPFGKLFWETQLLTFLGNSLYFFYLFIFFLNRFHLYLESLNPKKLNLSLFVDVIF